MFQLTGTDLVNTTPSANSKEIVTESPFSISKNPFVGPLPVVLGWVSKSPSPSTSCKKPVRIISPEKIPELDEVSVNLYGFKKFSPDEILIEWDSLSPIESIWLELLFQLGALMKIKILSVQE